MASENLKLKQQTVAEIKDKFSRAKSIVFVDYKGTNVSQVTELRSEMRKNATEYKVYKNNLMLRALTELGISGTEQYFAGTTAVAISYDDEVVPASVIDKAAKDNNNLQVKFGIINGAVVDGDYVKKLAKIPSRETLLTQLVGMLQAPIRNFACTIKAVADKNA